MTAHTRALVEAERTLRAAARGLDRRAFLRLAGAAAATGLLPVGCSGSCADVAPPPGLPLQHLSPRTYAVLQTASMRLMGPGAEALIRDGRLDAARRADAWLAHVPGVARTLQQALLLLEFGLPPLVDKWRPFTALAPPAQDEVLEALMRSRFDFKRALFQGIKSLAALAVYGSAEGRALCAWPGLYGNADVGIQDAMGPLP